MTEKDDFHTCEDCGGTGQRGTYYGEDVVCGGCDGEGVTSYMGEDK